ncbi:hypothetical protein MMC26_001357 [Xylographa opegraphella]|nr:hypothetical protein [Xylographa opegraphella]
MNRRDPRIRQTLNNISSTLESANLTTQASLFSFSEAYINPCLSSITTCLEASCYPCFGAQRDVERRRNRSRMGRSTQRGRPELVFDFYNDEWDDLDDGEGAGLLGGWGNDELDRLLAGSGGGGREDQPGRKRAMSYGSRGLKRKGVTLPGKGDEMDPTVIPNSSMFGFLERLPWKIGGRGVKYKPSAADLQEHPGRKNRAESEALLEESEGEGTAQKQQRKRRGTTTSRSTNNSLSSRGDLFPSEDEDDAVPLDDEFAMVLERRTTTTGSDEASSRNTKGKRPSASGISSKTASSRDTKNISDNPQHASIPGEQADEPAPTPETELPTLEDLRLEEERVRQQEDAEVERKREAAHKLALDRGLPTDGSRAPTTPSEGPSHPPDEESQIPTPPAMPPQHHEADSTPQPESDEHRQPLSPRSIASIEPRRTGDLDAEER